jgi:hypothetical protein
MQRPRTRFLAALGVFVAWLGVLIGLAVATGHRPPASLPAERPAPRAAP